MSAGNALPDRGSGIARVGDLWQFPLLLLSLGLFGVATYLFVDPRPGPTIDEKIDVARAYLRVSRPEASIEQLNRILATQRLMPDKQAAVHLLLAESLEMAQKQLKISVPANHARIIEQTRLAIGQGAKPDWKVYKRLGESFEALGRPTDALENYRLASAMAPDLSLSLKRKVIDLQLDQTDLGPAEASLDDYLRAVELTDAERAWALGQKSQMLIDQGKFADARSMLAEALRLSTDEAAMGEVNYRLGYCAYKLGDTPEAERFLRVARDQLRVQHPTDADAAYWLGRIYQDRNEHAVANSFYDVVLTSHPGSRVSTLAHLGRATGRIALRNDDAGLMDLQSLVGEIGRRASRARFKTDVIDGLRNASQLLGARANFQGALEVLAYEQQLDPDPPPGFYARLANVYDKRSDQVEQSLPDLAPAERIKRQQQVRSMRVRAGDSYVAYSRALTVADDTGYGEALWKGIDLYDRAADTQSVISALELFVAERPDDGLAPDALLRLGRSYQATGQFDKAIGSFLRNQFRYPKSLATQKSLVPLAQAYIAKGPDFFNKAEQVLLGVVDNNPQITPEAQEFKQSLMELAQLYYRNGRYEEAVARLEELTQRYPRERQIGQMLFLMADSYRKSATLLELRLASSATQPTSGPTGTSLVAEQVEAMGAKRDRLAKARDLFDRVVETYRLAPPETDTDKLYQKLAHFYRADCLYDLGQYEESIRFYDAAAFRYQDDPSALAAYVQIVNAYAALGKLPEAKTANERAKWLLRRMPQESFTDGSFSMPKSYWEQWLKWTSESGMW